jgi:hypothetical protein
MLTAMKSTFLVPLLLIAFLAASCSSPGKTFEEELGLLMPENPDSEERITEERISALPEPVRNYLHFAGFVGEPMSDATEILWADSKIRFSPDSKWMTLRTKQYNFPAENARLAFMQARIAGFIPFEGRDRFHGGEGHMLGTIGRLFNVFDDHSSEVALGGAVIVLAEALLEPTIALREYIDWIPVDGNTARAVFTVGGLQVSGTFFFNDAGEFTRFESDDRPFDQGGGEYKNVPYSITLEEYTERDGLMIPGRVFATWHLDSGDFTYWDGRITGLRRGLTAENY